MIAPDALSLGHLHEGLHPGGCGEHGRDGLVSHGASIDATLRAELGQSDEEYVFILVEIGSDHSIVSRNVRNKPAPDVVHRYEG